MACECFHGIGLSSAGQSSSEEDVPLSKLHHREHAPATDDENETDSNEEEISGADDSDSFHPAEDSAEDEDAPGSDDSFLLPKKIHKKTQEDSTGEACRQTLSSRCKEAAGS